MENSKTKIGILIENDKTLKECLTEMASNIPDEYDSSHWCYLPYWFNIVDGKIIAIHINNLPESFVNQIKDSRDIIGEQKTEQ